MSGFLPDLPVSGKNHRNSTRAVTDSGGNATKSGLTLRSIAQWRELLNDPTLVKENAGHT